VTHAIVGNRVIFHPGARVGQDGFGFAMGGTGHLKVPQIGRVLIVAMMSRSGPTPRSTEERCPTQSSANGADLLGDVAQGKRTRALKKKF
jgi:hypothetical protein